MSAALLILDMISLFDFEGGKALARNATSIAGNIEAMRKGFARRGLPVIFVNDNFLDWNREFTELVALCAHPARRGCAVARLLTPSASDYYILKPKHSAFLCTALPAILADLRVQELVITGVATDSCVLMTAQDAHMRDYRVRVPRDCVAAQTHPRSERALKLMADSMGTDTAPGASVIRRLARNTADRR